MFFKSAFLEFLEKPSSMRPLNLYVESQAIMSNWTEPTFSQQLYEQASTGERPKDSNCFTFVSCSVSLNVKLKRDACKYIPGKISSNPDDGARTIAMDAGL